MMKKVLLLCAVATLAVAGCKKEKAEPTEDIEIVFNSSKSNISIEIVTNYASNPDVRYIYLIPENYGYSFQEKGAAYFHQTKIYMQELIDINPKKVKGSGNFQIKPGAPTQMCDDSLWFVKNGWTINKY